MVGLNLIGIILADVFSLEGRNDPGRGKKQRCVWETEGRSPGTPCLAKALPAVMSLPKTADVASIGLRRRDSGEMDRQTPTHTHIDASNVPSQCPLYHLVLPLAWPVDVSSSRCSIVGR